MSPASGSSPLVLSDTRDCITTLTMNQPARLNGWTTPMVTALREAMTQAAEDDGTKVVILTGTDPYYCAGVNLGAAVRPRPPRALYDFIVDYNQRLFEIILLFPKPLLIAINGPALGASATASIEGSRCAFLVK